MGYMTMALVARIVTLVLLTGKSVRTPGLRLFRALVISSRGEILGLPVEPLI
jgi:hypothetical protein